MKEYTGIVALHNGVIHEYPIKAKNLEHAKNKLNIAMIYESYSVWDVFKKKVEEKKEWSDKNE